MREGSTRITKRLWITIGATALVLACGLLICRFVVLPLIALDKWAEEGAPCIEGEAGEPAIFENTGTVLFTFPESATAIENTCFVFQDASIRVWFQMDGSEVNSLIESMRWELPPLAASSEIPFFGNPNPKVAYQLSEFNQPSVGVSLWVDTSATPYRVYIFISQD